MKKIKVAMVCYDREKNPGKLHYLMMPRARNTDDKKADDKKTKWGR